MLLLLNNGRLLVAGAVAILGVAYNAAVDKYGDWRVEQMQKLPLPNSPSLSSSSANGIQASHAITKSVNELRQTVSKRTGLVENLDDRRAWNAWLSDLESDSGQGLMPGTTLTFMYRSYANFEEAGNIKKSLLHVKTWLGFTASKRGIMTVDQDGERVNITETLRQRVTTPVTITWNGVVKKRGRKVVWTDSEMTIGSTKTVNPAGAEKLRQVPWDVIKEEDGMLAFQRGDFGILVYDSKTTQR